MCGIVGAVAQRNVSRILVEGLKRLEYRGYDSAGVALLEPETQEIQRVRVLGKVAKLEQALTDHPTPGHVGIAHTRWATHGQPTQSNAHPHTSNDEIAVVHNGIIENHDALREKLIGLGYQFLSETDTEVIVHLIHHHYKTAQNMLDAIKLATAELEGAYALGIIAKADPESLYTVRLGSPLVIGLGIGEHFIGSDPLALLPVTQRFIYLEEGDIAHLTINQIEIFDANGKPVERKEHISEQSSESASKGNYRHFMLKEIFEQPEALGSTINAHIINHKLIEQAFGHNAQDLFAKVKRIQIVACGTSFHAGLVGRHWIESIAGLPCHVEIASENRYRQQVVEPDTLFIALSQSGETADTLAALRQAKKRGYVGTLGICNVPESSLAREADLIFLTRAGAEVGVAATKTFTAQLVALLLLAAAFAGRNADQATQQDLIDALLHLPRVIQETLELDDVIQQLSKRFSEKNHALFLGRGNQTPIAMEGALKLKEISYVHAEAYPAGELKHGPLALVDNEMPIIVVAPKNELSDKLQSNIQEVQARGGELFIFADQTLNWPQQNGSEIIPMPTMPDVITPIAYTIPLQLLSYHIAVLKGTDVDQPRNLAKSVTVE